MEDGDVYRDRRLQQLTKENKWKIPNVNHIVFIEITHKLGGPLKQAPSFLFLTVHKFTKQQQQQQMFNAKRA